MKKRNYSTPRSRMADVIHDLVQVTAVRKKVVDT